MATTTTTFFQHNTKIQIALLFVSLQGIAFSYSINCFVIVVGKTIKGSYAEFYPFLMLPTNYIFEFTMAYQN